jgi:hypothetical protein
MERGAIFFLHTTRGGGGAIAVQQVDVHFPLLASLAYAPCYCCRRRWLARGG